MPRSKILILGGAVALAAAIVGVSLFFPAAPPPADEEPEAAAPVRPTSSAPARPGAAPAARVDTDDPAAKALFEAASTPSAFREVWLKYPNTTWGKRAEERFRAMDTTARAAVDREFEDVRRRAAGLGAAEAVAAWRDYAAKAAPDNRPKAEAAALEVENRDRAAFNETVAKARERAERGAYAEAAELFAALAKGATEEVAARCAEAAADLKKAGEDVAAAKRAEAIKTTRVEAGPKALAALRARRYADALAALAGEDAELASERAAVERARAFWGAFLAAAKAKAGQDVSLLLAGNKRLAGKLEGVQGERATLRGPDGALEVPLDQVALDQVAAWAFGKAPDGAACLDAAMFFFAEGRDDLASTYLATAREKGADPTETERVWRDGLVRAAIWSAAQPKIKPPPKKKG